MAPKERKGGGGDVVDYLSTLSVGARRNTLRLNRIMCLICQKINGGK